MVKAEASSTEQALVIARQNSQYPQHKFWRAFASARSVEHASDMLITNSSLVSTLFHSPIINIVLKTYKI